MDYFRLRESRVSSRLNTVWTRSGSASGPHSGRRGHGPTGKTGWIGRNDPEADMERGKLSRSFARVVLPDLRRVVQDDIQQGITDCQQSVAEQYRAAI
jgi:hypothetical protein